MDKRGVRDLIPEAYDHAIRELWDIPGSLGLISQQGTIVLETKKIKSLWLYGREHQGMHVKETFNGEVVEYDIYREIEDRN